MNSKAKKLLAGFMAVSMVAFAGCAPISDEEEDEPGYVTSTWDDSSQSWHHYRSFRGQDYYFGSGAYPHPATVINSSNPKIAKSMEAVSSSKMTAGGSFAGVRSSISSGKSGIGGGGGRSSISGGHGGGG